MGKMQNYSEKFLDAWDDKNFFMVEQALQNWENNPDAVEESLSEYLVIYLEDAIALKHQKSNNPWVKLLAPYTEVKVCHLNQAYLSGVSDDLFQYLLSHSSIDSIQKLVDEKKQEEYEGYSLKENYMTMLYAVLDRQTLDAQTPLVSRRSSSVRL